MRDLASRLSRLTEWKSQIVSGRYEGLCLNATDRARQALDNFAQLTRIALDNVRFIDDCL